MTARLPPRSKGPGGSPGEGNPVPQHDFAVRLLRDMVVPAFVLDHDGRVIIWNRACEWLTGVPSAELIGTRAHWQALYDHERPCLADLILQQRTGELESWYAQSDRTSHSGTAVHAENWCVMPRLGTRRYLAIDAGPIVDDAGSVVAVLETLRDMTVQHNALTAMEQLAAEDPLTGIANRRTLAKFLAREWRRATRQGSRLALILLDIDFFKRFNDSYGHQRGDECLQAVAGVLSRCIQREGELVARYGGEEFAVVLPHNGSADVALQAERLRLAVAGLGIAHSGSPIADVVTVSLGCATLHGGRAEGSVDGLIGAADAALYAAKQLGRNRVHDAALVADC